MRKSTKIILLLVALLSFQNRVYANTWGFNVPSTGPGGDTSGNSEPTPIQLGSDAAGNSYSCHYNISLGVSNDITTNVYDRDGTLLNPHELTPKVETAAGTALDMEIYEEKVVTWDVTKVEVKKTSAVTYNCRSIAQVCTGCQSTLSIKGLRPIINTCKCDYRRLFGVSYCPMGYKVTSENGGVETTETSGEYYNQCKQKAEDMAKKAAISAMFPSYVIKLQNPNNINQTNTVDIRSNSCGSNGAKYSKCTYVYSANKTCINVKTAEVRYIIDNSSCTNDEFELNRVGNKFKYFIPLNAKSTDNFFLSVSSAGSNSIQNGAACKYVINNYSNYSDLIITADGKQFSGNKNKDLTTAEKGCYLSSVVGIPVKQSFYNEEKNKIRGYGSFYRPIDINNPFPNGISNDSYWNNIINNNVVSVTDKSNKTKTYDLSKSFNELTYSIYNINASAIRDYNHQERNFYTSWEDMKKDGTSTFIDNFVTRNKNNDYYKLGCGPANSNWEGCLK